MCHLCKSAIQLVTKSVFGFDGWLFDAMLIIYVIYFKEGRDEIDIVYTHNIITKIYNLIYFSV